MNTGTTITCRGTTASTEVDVFISIEVGAVERRVVSFFCEPIKRMIYDLVSMKLGRDSAEATAFKGQVREIVREARGVAYEILNDHLEHDGQITRSDVVEAIRYIFPTDQKSGVFYRRLYSLVKYTFGGRADDTMAYFNSRIADYITNRIPRLEREYEAELSGAREHIERRISLGASDNAG